MPPDLSVFQRQKTIIDQQQLQDAFNLKKALAIQAAQKDALETQALQSQAANGGLTLKDMLTFQTQQQNNAETLDFKRLEAARNEALRRDQLAQQAQIARDNNALRADAFSARNDEAAARAAEARQKKIEAEAERYGKTLESTGLSELLSAAERAANVAAGEGDIAGYGPAVNALPSFLVSQAGKNNRQEISGLKNTILKARSGGAVTPQEAERLGSEIGDNIGSDDMLLRKGINNVSSTLAEKLANAQSAFSPEAIQLYEGRGGIGAGFASKYRKSAETPAIQPMTIDPAAARAELERRAAARKAGGQ